MARPPKLTKELQARIVQRVRIGTYPEVAAGAEGVPRSVFFEWMARGRGEHPTRPATAALEAFAHAVSTAADEAEAIINQRHFEFEQGVRQSRRTPGKLVKTRISSRQVAAMQWRLARSRPERWAHRTVVEGQGPADYVPPKIEIVLTSPKLSDEEYDAQREREERESAPDD